jgi:hypothetical protein
MLDHHRDRRASVGDHDTYSSPVQNPLVEMYLSPLGIASASGGALIGWYVAPAAMKTSGAIAGAVLGPVALMVLAFGLWAGSKGKISF